MQNRGVILTPPEPTDFLVGALTYEVINPAGLWPLPTGEKQIFTHFDSYSCVSFSALNSCECQLKYQMGLPTFPKFLEKWLNDNGYIDEQGNINFSDRYIAKLSGTIPNQGNSVKKVWDAIRRYGLAPEKDWPVWDDMQQNEFFADVPQNIINKGQEFLKYFEISYEFIFGGPEGKPVNQLPFTKQLRQAPIQLITACCDPWSGGVVIPACGESPVHATLGYGVSSVCLFDYDSYDKFTKKLSPNYLIWQAMKGIIKFKTQEITTEMTRHAWQNSPDVKVAYPAPKFLNPLNPEDDIYQWAHNWGQFDHKKYFDSTWAGRELVIQPEGTFTFYLWGPGGGQITDPAIVEKAEVLIWPPEDVREEFAIPLDAPHLEIKKNWLVEFFKKLFNIK